MSSCKCTSLLHIDVRARSFPVNSSAEEEGESKKWKPFSVNKHNIELLPRHAPIGHHPVISS